MSQFDQQALQEQLAELSKRHKSMDNAIKLLERDAISIDQVKISRLKKEKLLLKEHIEKVKSDLIPDNLA